MGAITGTLIGPTEFAGNFRLIVVTATCASASDTITLTEANTGCRSISAVIGAVITGGLDTLFSYLQVSASGLVVTVVSFAAAGTSATDFTGTTVTITLLGNTTA